MSDLTGWHWPAPGNTRITQSFLPGHGALDVGLGEGSTIVAPQAGTITAVYDTEGYGTHIVLDTVDGARVILAHLSEILYPTGYQVEAGAPIGKSGNTGKSTGPHLHYEIRYDGAPLDPHYVVYGNIADNPPPYPDNPPGSAPPGSMPPGSTIGPGGVIQLPPGSYSPPGNNAVSVLSMIDWGTVMIFTGGLTLFILGLIFLAGEETIKLSLRGISEPLSDIAEATAQ